MKKLCASLLVAGALMGAAAASNAQVLFNYTAVTTFAATGTPVVTQGPFTLTAAPGADVTPDNAAFPGTDIVVGAFSVVTTDPLAGTTHFDQDFSVLLTILRPGGGTNTGILTGNIQFDVNGTQTNSTAGIFTNLPQTITVDGIVFTVSTPVSFTNVSAPGGPPATYSVHITAPQGVVDVPEPGSMAMLLGAGAGSLLVIRRRRKA
jgi:hypothetical protein